MQPFGICFSELFRTARTVRWKIFLSGVVGVVLVALSLLFVWSSKRVVDCATGNSQFPMNDAVAIMAVTMVCQIALRIFQRYWEGYLLVNTGNELRAGVYSKVLHSTWYGREKFHSGDMVNRLEGDIAVVVDFICVTLPEFVVTLIQFTASCVFLFRLSPHLAWILVFIMPVAVIGSRLFFKKMRLLTNEIRAVDSRIQGHIQETLQHRVLVKTLGCTLAVLEKLHLLQSDVKGKNITRLNYSAFSRAFIQIGFASGYALAFFWGAYGIRNGTVTYGLMVAFLQLVSQVQRTIADITKYIPSFIKALSSEDRLLELENLPQEEETDGILIPGAPGVRVENVSYTYPGGSKEVIRNLSFDFKQGTMTVITGPTGAGKSSLLRIVLALLKPSAGRVVLYGGSREYLSDVNTRVNFMYVPQGNSLMSGTIRENLQLADPSVSEDDMRQALRLAAADFVMSLPEGLDTSVSEIGGGLSEGQAQRIAIARALLRPGGVLILDEATSALDSDTELNLLKNISAYFKGKKTIICVTHRPAACEYADANLSVAETGGAPDSVGTD